MDTANARYYVVYPGVDRPSGPYTAGLAAREVTDCWLCNGSARVIRADGSPVPLAGSGQAVHWLDGLFVLPLRMGPLSSAATMALPPIDYPAWQDMVRIASDASDPRCADALTAMEICERWRAEGRVREGEWSSSEDERTDPAVLRAMTTEQLIARYPRAIDAETPGVEECEEDDRIPDGIQDIEYDDEGQPSRPVARGGDGRLYIGESIDEGLAPVVYAVVDEAALRAALQV